MTKMDRIDEILNVVKAQEAAGLAKAKSILEDVKEYDLSDLPIPDLQDLFKKEEPVQKKKCNWCLIATIIIGVIVVAAVIYGLYCYFTPDYLDDFDDDFEDDDFEDDDFFVDEDKE